MRAVLVTVVAIFAGAGLRGQAAPPAPILVVVNSAAPNPFGAYLPEILRAEGINSFDVVQLSALDAPTLAAATLAVLAETPLTAPQAALFTNYVAGGGRLVAMRPDPQLNAVLGITQPAGATTDGYVLVNQSGPGAGLQDVTLPFRGVANHFALAGAVSAAELYDTRSTSAGSPAVVRFNGTAAWAFDLARSTAYVRQGDPAFAGLDRDGLYLPPAYRATDIFFQKIDLERVGIPHADVQMRLFSRVVGELLAQTQPFPKLWYFPGTHRTMVIPTADAHVSTPAPYAALIAAAESFGARVSIYPARYVDLSGSPVASWVANGHEVGLHPYFSVETPPQDFTQGYTQAADWFASALPFLPGPSPTTRHHTLEWGGWVDPVSIMSSFGIRMDLSYYAWGPVFDNPALPTQAHGYVTGSGLPMRFVDTSGQVLPVYQQVTALTDEQFFIGAHSQNLTTQEALDISRGLIDDSQAGGYSAIATQFHVDYYTFGNVGAWADGVMQYAAGLEIPMWTAERWLRFNEARNQTAITNIAWTAGTGQLAFSATVPAGAEPQTVMLPPAFGGQVFTNVTVDGLAVPHAAMAVNGLGTRFFQVAPLPSGGARQVVVTYGGPPVVSIGNASAVEGAGPATFTVELTAPSAQTVTVDYATAGGTATADTDYTSVTGTLTFAPGELSKALPVAVVNDSIDENDETFTVTLTAPVNAVLGAATGTGTIVDNDAPPSLEIAGVTVAEGTGGSVNAVFAVGLSAASGRTVTVNYATANGTATAGADYVAAAGQLTFTPGVVSQNISVAVTGDALDEDDETFTVTLATPANATIGTAVGTGVITDDDAAPVVSVADVTLAEGNSGTANAVFAVGLSAASSRTVTVNYATANGTATAGADYTAAAGQLTFAPGVVSQNISVPVTGDTLDEDDETFTVTLATPVNATIGTAVGTGTITDDDAASALSVTGVTLVEGDGGTTDAVFVVGLSPASGRTVTVNYATANGTAIAGADYTAAVGQLTFAPGVVSRSITVAVLGDLLVEPTETFTVGLSAPVNATIGVGSATASITDDDFLPTTVADAISTPFSTLLSVPAPGVLSNDDDKGAGALTAVLVSSPAHGTLTLGADGSVLYAPAAAFSGTDSFTYRASSNRGQGNTVTVVLTVEAPTTVQSPEGLRVSAVNGNVVTFRWNPPAVGPAPTGYVIEGGALSGQTLATLPVPQSVPISVVSAPRGSWYVRVRALGVGGPSHASNEIVAHVGVPIAPSAPTGLLGTVRGTSVHLSWSPTFEGGTPAGVVLDVTGSMNTSVPLSPLGQASFDGVPAGSYTLSLRAVNPTGSSPASAPIALTVPVGCGGAPEPPMSLLAYVSGGTTFAVWDAPSAGEAAVSYVVTVPGVGTLATTQRAVSGVLPRGTFTVLVQSVGACGTSAAVSQVLTVP